MFLCNAGNHSMDGTMWKLRILLRKFHRHEKLKSHSTAVMNLWLIYTKGLQWLDKTNESYLNSKSTISPPIIIGRATHHEYRWPRTNLDCSVKNNSYNFLENHEDHFHSQHALHFLKCETKAHCQAKVTFLHFAIFTVSQSREVCGEIWFSKRESHACQ